MNSFLKKSLRIFFILSWISGAWADSLIAEAVLEANLAGYTEEEKRLIEKDKAIVHDLIFQESQKPKSQGPYGPIPLLYLGTAGAPGSSKTTVLEEALKRDNNIFAYIDPDQRCLKFMVNTYLSGLTNYAIAKNDREGKNYQDLLQSQYEKWRGASNYIANTALNRAFEEGFSIAHGTTATGPHMAEFYEKLKEKGYKISLILCFSCEENRLKAIEHRKRTQCFVQSAPEDVVRKATLFEKQVADGLYLRYANDIYYMWVEAFNRGGEYYAILDKGYLRLINEGLFKMTFCPESDLLERHIDSLLEIESPKGR